MPNIQAKPDICLLQNPGLVDVSTAINFTVTFNSGAATERSARCDTSARADKCGGADFTCLVDFHAGAEPYTLPNFGPNGTQVAFTR